MRAFWLVGIIVIQVAFVAAGLAITFITINFWVNDQRLDSIFAGSLGGYCFFVTWLSLRRWIIDRSALWSKSPRE